MTLIALLAHPDYLMIAADTLMTIPGTNGEREAVENACKLAQVNYVGVLGFSGLAKIEGIRAHRWATEHLADFHLKGGLWQNRIPYLQEKATAAFQRSPLCGERHAFIYAEWVRDHINNEFVIQMHAISNALDTQLNWLHKAKDSFETMGRVLTPTTCTLSTIGARVSDADVKGALSQIMTDQNLPRSQALKLLQDLIINKSADKKAGVGSEVMSLCIPKSTIGKGMFVLNSDPDADSATFRHINSVGEQFREEAPLMLMGNAISQFAGSDDGVVQSAEIRHIRLSKPQIQQC